MQHRLANGPRAREDLLPTRASLIARLKGWDDNRSWQEFFDTLYWRLIYGRARNAELSDAEAQEVVQETIIAVAKYMPRFEYKPNLASFKTWFYQIVSRRIADQYRRKRRGLSAMEPLPGAGEQPETESSAAEAGTSPDAIWDAEWRQAMLVAAEGRVKRKVSVALFQVFDYHVLQDHTAAETARHLKTNRAAVYLAKHRVGKLMREELRQLGEEGNGF